MNPRDFFSMEVKLFLLFKNKSTILSNLAENYHLAWRMSKGNVRRGIIPTTNFVSHPNHRFQRLRRSSLHRYAIAGRWEEQSLRERDELRKSKTDNLTVGKSVGKQRKWKAKLHNRLFTAELNECATLQPSNCCSLQLTVLYDMFPLASGLGWVCQKASNSP